MIVAIPSHERYKMIQDKTLSFLKNTNFPMKDVYIFVSPKSYKEYADLPDKWGVYLVKSKNSIMDTRNQIIRKFPTGTKIVELDDDVKSIKKIGGNTIPDSKAFFEESFNKLPNKGLWGINANLNKFYAGDMTDKMGVRSIVNSVLGYYNDKRIKMTVKEKEDFDRVLQFHKLGLPILKRTGYGVQTNYWTNKGGIQAHYDAEERKKVQAESAEALLKKFPNCCYKVVRKNGITDIRIKNNLK